MEKKEHNEVNKNQSESDISFSPTRELFFKYLMHTINLT